jgi:hypothetical protein
MRCTVQFSRILSFILPLLLLSHPAIISPSLLSPPPFSLPLSYPYFYPSISLLLPYPTFLCSQTFLIYLIDDNYFLTCFLNSSLIVASLFIPIPLSSLLLSHPPLLPHPLSYPPIQSLQAAVYQRDSALYATNLPISLSMLVAGWHPLTLLVPPQWFFKPSHCGRISRNLSALGRNLFE